MSKREWSHPFIDKEYGKSPVERRFLESQVSRLLYLMEEKHANHINKIVEAAEAEMDRIRKGKA